MKTKINTFLTTAWKLLTISIPIAFGLAMLVGILCLIFGWRSFYEYATALQYAAMLTALLGGLGIMAEYMRPRLVTHTPYAVSAQYKHRLGVIDSNAKLLTLGILVAVFLYFISKMFFLYA